MELESRVRTLSATSTEVDPTSLPDLRYDRFVHEASHLFRNIIEDAVSENLFSVDSFL